MDERLDTLLSQPLAEMPDNGFSSRVMAQVEAEVELQRLRKDRLVTEIGMGLVVLCVLVLPFTPAGALLAASAASTIGMVLVGVACIAATLFAARAVSR
jgi:hypothetical protein